MIQPDFFSDDFFFFAFGTSQFFFYSENATMTCFEQRNPRIQSFDTKCYETNSQKDRKDR